MGIGIVRVLADSGFIAVCERGYRRAELVPAIWARQAARSGRIEFRDGCGLFAARVVFEGRYYEVGHQEKNFPFCP
jgi:hypothetical protein